MGPSENGAAPVENSKENVIFVHMKVLFVVNNFYGKGNGLQSSARRTVQYLKRSGVDVRVLSMRNPDPSPDAPQPEYPLQEFIFPFFQSIIEAQCYAYAKSDKKIIREACQWADVVHLEEAFPLEKITADIARSLGKAVVSTFHLYPENITSSLSMGWWKGLNHAILWWMRSIVFNKCSDIQCPTQNVLERLQRFHFKARLHLIPNGAILDEPSDSDTLKKPGTDPYILLCIGRLAVEKDQPTLLRAMKYSKYRDRIQLNFAGKGPEEDKIRRMADKYVRKGILKYPPVFGFHTLDELRSLARESYLYIHCAPIEVEGLSCIEAIREGTVPVIAQAPLSATSQFALDERSLFPAKNPEALAQKIDWWIEHPVEREEMSPKYIESVEKYDINKSIESLVEMYRLAMESK